MEATRVVLEYLRVILSWPVVVALCAILFAWRFRSALDFLIRNISVRTPGGTEISAQQAKPATAQPEQPQAEAKERQLLGLVAQTLTLSQRDREQWEAAVRDVIGDLESRATLWEYSYWSLFLVPKTRLVLLWVNSQAGLTYQQFCSLWPTWNFGPDTEREAVLAALQGAAMLVNIQGVLQVTPKGTHFLRFIGFLPKV